LHSYDDEGLVFYSKDTYLGPFGVGRDRVDSYAEIIEGWRQFNYTFLVVYPDEQEELVNSILGREYLDPITMWQNAARKAEAETQENPEDPYAWFNLGTSLTRIGEITGDAAFYQQGASAFDRAVVIGLPGRMLWYQFRIFIAYMKMERYEDMITLVDNLQGNADARVREGAQYVEELYLYKGHALAFLGNIAEARAAYEQGLALNENSYPIQWALDSIQ
jgi:tetratricopeptide (TPR) repeat protein